MAQLIQDTKLELSFLSSLADLSTYDMQEAKRLVESKGVTEQEFARLEHWHAYCGIAKCISLGLPASPDNLVREISVFDRDQAVNLAKSISSADGVGSFVDGYCDKLLEVSERRQTLKQLEDAARRVQSGTEPAGAVRFRLSNNLLRTRGRVPTKGLDEYVAEVEQHIQDVSEGKLKPVTPWYIPKLDQSIGGLQPTLILIGAEPGVGKSALIASAVNLQAMHGHKPFVASLEDSPGWLAWRLVSNNSKMNQFDLRFQKIGKGKVEELKKQNAEFKSQRSRIRVIDGSISGMRIEDLISSINDAIVNEGCDSVWVDHLGEIQLTNSERTDLEISRHLSLLRGVANKHKVPVIVAAHFKRPPDPSMPPSFRDFANSSGSERKARIALGLRREPGSDSLAVHVMKQTNGPAGQVVDLNFSGAAAMIIENEGGYK